MRRLAIIGGCLAVFVCLSGGCGERASANKTGEAVRSRSSTAQIPLSIAGTWQQRNKGKWRMIIEPNGAVSSAFVPFEVIIRPYQTTRQTMVDGTVSTFVGGDNHAEYNSANREMFVIVEMKELHISIFGHMCDGNEVDTFTGPVSEDGLEWRPDWLQLFNYGPDFPQDVNNIEPNPIVFDRVEEWRPPADKQTGPKR